MLRTAKRLTPRVVLAVLFACLAPLAGAQTGNGGGSNSQTGPQPFDACGTLVRGTECVLFEGGGGKYYVPDTGGHHVGDTIRVVGTLDPNCATFCQDADGCISGAKVYDPAVYPCGTAIPSFPGDIITNACTTISAGTLALSIVGMYLTRGTRRAKVIR